MTLIQELTVYLRVHTNLSVLFWHNRQIYKPFPLNDHRSDLNNIFREIQHFFGEMIVTKP